MSILQECPNGLCRLRQKMKNKVCKCGEDLDKAKRSKKVRYWVAFRMPDGKQRQECLSTIADVDPYSIEDARDVNAKRQVQKKEKDPLFGKRQVQRTFDQLTEWYLELLSVQRLAALPRIKIALAHFNRKFGSRPAATVTKSEIEDFYQKRVNDGSIAPSTASVELSIVKGLMGKARADKLIDADVSETFHHIKPMAKRGACARKRTVTIPEYLKLIETAPAYLRGMVILAMNTGMRPGEIKRLRWSYIDQAAGFIRLPAEATKERAAKSIPLNSHAKAVLKAVVRRLDSDMVFIDPSHEVQGPRCATRFLIRTCKAAGVAYGRKDSDGITMHDFRRTAKTNMARAGVGDVFRNAILGHAMQGMDRHYISLTDDDLRNAMDTYTAWLDTEIAKVTQTVTNGGVANG